MRPLRQHELTPANRRLFLSYCTWLRHTSLGSHHCGWSDLANVVASRILSRGNLCAVVLSYQHVGPAFRAESGARDEFKLTYGLCDFTIYPSLPTLFKLSGQASRKTLCLVYFVPGRRLGEGQLNVQRRFDGRIDDWHQFTRLWLVARLLLPPCRVLVFVCRVLGL